MARIDTRPLTPGEVALVAMVFGAALDPVAVTLRRAKFWLLQPVWVVMAPDGHIWFHPDGEAWHDDFSTAAPHLRALFVHEMVHVWQRQCGIRLWLRRYPLARYAYRLVPGKPFGRYGIEQQACIVEDAYRRRETGAANTAVAGLIPFGTWA
ncbi:MAG: vgr related protein [Polymorphobacter sp.]